MTIGIALLGVTHPHASARAEAFSRIPGTRIVAVCEPDPVAESFCRYLKVPRKTLEETLADPAVGVCLIHSRTSEAAGYAVAALKAGKAVLSEKPCAPNSAELKRIAEAVERSGGVFQAGYNFRQSPVVDLLQRVVKKNLIGHITQVRVHGGCALREHLAPLLNQPDDIGGAFFVIGCHVVDILLSLFGKPQEIGATVGKFSAVSDGSSREDVVAAAFLYDGMLASVDFASQDPLGHVESYEFFLNGLNGVVYAKILPAEYRIFLSDARNGLAKGWSTWEETTYPIEWSGVITDYSPIIPVVSNLSFFEREAKRFIDVVRGGGAVPIDIAHAQLVVDSIDACYCSSANGGQRIRF